MYLSIKPGLKKIGLTQLKTFPCESNSNTRNKLTILKLTRRLFRYFQGCIIKILKNVNRSLSNEKNWGAPRSLTLRAKTAAPPSPAHARAPLQSPGYYNMIYHFFTEILHCVSCCLSSIIMFTWNRSTSC